MELGMMVDIVMPVRNGLDCTKLCVQSIYNHTDLPFNLIIINNASSDGTYEYLEELKKKKDNLKVIHNKEGQGWVGGINQGIEAGSSPYVCFMSNDVVVSSQWLRKMLDKIDAPNIAAVGPISNNVSGQQNISCSNPKSKSIEETNLLIGFVMLLRREVLDQLKHLDGFYLDPIFNPGSSDDLDLSIRLRKMGYKLLIARDVYCHHFGSDNFSSLHEEKYQLLVNKWGQDEINKWLGKQPRVLIGIPTIGNADRRFLLSLLQTNMPCSVAYEMPYRMMPDMARNLIIEQALQYNFDYVLFLDDDMCWEDQDIIAKMLSYNKDIVGTVTHTRLAPYMPCVFKKNGNFFDPIEEFDKGLIEVDALGGAFMLIKTEVFRKMERPWFEFKSIRFLGIEKERYGEDVYFYKKAKDAGFEVWCDTDTQVIHIGEPQLVSKATRKMHNEVTEKAKKAIMSLEA